MNFQGLAKIEKAQFYLDTAFNQASKRIEIKKSGVHIKDRLSKSKQIESMRIQFVHDNLNKYLYRILNAFPKIDDLPEFYKELVKCTIDYLDLKKSLGALKWAADKITHFYKLYNSKIHKTVDMMRVNQHRREYYGRVSSIMKQINDDLLFVDEARKVMKGYPAIKTSMKSIALVGFPNVGKTTLLYKLTGSKPEINSYAFTTKGINVGYMKSNDKRIQVLDTPGTLDRFNKMNGIEKQAYLAMKYCVSLLVYVFDLTEPFPLKEQLQLYARIKKDFDTKMVVYFSKSDILDKAKIDDFMIEKDIKGFTNIDDIKAIID